MKAFPAFRRPLPTTITMETPPKRKRGTEVLLGRRYALAVEIALTIPPGNSRVPKGILGPLAERCGVGSYYPRRHWAECKAQIDEIGELDLSNKRRSGRPLLLTPTKSAALWKINKENRSFSLRQVSDQLKDMGMDYGSETVRWCFEKEGAVKVARRIKPSLWEAQRKRRIDFICDQVDETTG